MSIGKISHTIRSLAATHDLAACVSGEVGAGATIRVKHAYGSLSSFVTGAIMQGEAHDGQVLCLTPDEDQASFLAADLTVILEATSADATVVQLPASGLRPYDEQQSSAYSGLQDRMDAILAIEGGFQGVVVASASALAERLPPPEALDAAAPTIRVGDRVKPEDLVQRLIELGFSVEEFVEDPGELALRGGIVDLFPFAGAYPIRIEFFGDEVESIREFEATSQKSVSRVGRARLVADPGRLDSRLDFGTLLDFAGPSAPVVVYEPERFLDELNRCNEEARDAYSSLEDGVFSDGEAAPLPERRFVDAPEIVRELTGRTVITVDDAGENPFGAPHAEIDFNASVPPVFNKTVSLLRNRIKDNAANSWTTLILCDGRGQMGRLEELLGEPTPGFAYQLVLSTIHRGFELPEIGLAVYTDHEIFNRYHRPTHGRKRHGAQKLTAAQLRSLSPGDFVVHADHGIGRFGGLQKKQVRGREQEVVKLLYKGDDVLFVNINSLHRLHKFSSREGHKPKLTRLGTGQWEKIKSKTKKRVKDIARALIKLYAERKSADGHAFSADTVWQRELEASFQYEDTPDQYQAAEDVKSDMQRPQPMDRLVCGDVGFGKTEIAVRAAFKAVQDGRQVAVLVPTTILAAQHLDTFTERLAPYAVNVDSLSRFRSTPEQKDTVKKLAAGEVDVIIGTHRLVSKDVKYRDLGLLIIDEEQRFGVSVKEKIRALRSEIDTLTLTATPIPRTLQFSLMGARDLSIINTPPPNRQPIITEVHSWDTRLVRDAILYEVKRGGQVFFIHNRVRTIDQMAATLEALVEGVRFRVAHGQMRPRDLEDVMHDFIGKKFDVLVSTNIVESGLDVTNANTMIIDRADRFGLADLHQLRGRVGRSDRKAFCYLFVPSIHMMTKEARHRLRAIEEFSELGSGFNIAMRDLDIRGAGNLLGAEQSGFIDEIGFETYHRILDEAVAELRNEEFGDLFGERGASTAIPVSDSAVDLEVDALIPADYVEHANQRLDLYRRLAEAGRIEEVDALVEEMTDRFGTPPDEAANLAIAAKMRVTAARMRLPKVEFKRNRLFLTVPDQTDAHFYGGVFENLLKTLNELDNRYVIKEIGSKTQIIIQEVADPDEALALLDMVAGEVIPA